MAVARSMLKGETPRGKVIAEAVRAGASLSKLSGDDLMEAYRSAPDRDREALLILAQVARQREARRRLKQAIQDEAAPVTPAVAAATQATENAWRQLEDEFGMFTSTEVSELLSPRGVNRKLASDMRTRGEILGTRRRNTVRYPAFQFDTARREVRPWVKRLIALADEYEVDHDEVILWLMRPTAYLGSLPDGTAPRPVDVADDQNKIVDVAEKVWESRW